MINFIKSKDSAKGETDLTLEIERGIKNGHKVVWTLPGGSNIQITVNVEKALRKHSADKLQNLTILQVDERFGPLGHPDSNWKQLKDHGFNSENIRCFPILNNLEMKETVENYSKIVDREFENADLIIGQFGIG